MARMRLIPAAGAVLEQILTESHEIWSDGLTPKAYGRFNSTQMATAWGRKHLRRFALVDDQDRLLSSAKRYDFTAKLDDREVSVVGIGAVFTPSSGRRQGYARRVVDEITAAATRDGADLALLFSEIDPAYYREMGFVAIQRPELVIRTKDKAGAPAVLVRAGEERDIPAVAHLARTMAKNHRFALTPSDDFLRFSLAKKRLLAALLPPNLLSVEFFIVEEGAGAVAFAILTVTADEVILEMCGDRDPAGARLGALLQVLRARTPAETARGITCFLPPDWLPPQIEIESSTAVREVMMVKPLKDGVLATPLRTNDVLYWHGDLF